MRPDRNSFGVIRLAMALAVLLSHSFFFVTGNPELEPFVTITGHSLGEHAVQVFFFLSGILVTQSLIKSASVIDFAVARTLRIAPALIVCVLATALLLGPLVTTLSPTAYLADPTLAHYVLKTLSLTTGAAPLPGVFTAQPAPGLVNMSLWTLKYEVMCYAALALAGLAGAFQPRYRALTTAALAALACLVFLKAPSVAQDYSHLENVRYFALYFSTGVVACLLKDHLVIKGWMVLALAVIYACLLGTPVNELACALFLGYATLYVASLDFGPLRRWTNATDLSFGVYIYAAPLQQAVLMAAPELGPLQLALAAAIPTLLLAFASWHLIEKPALGARKPLAARINATVCRSHRSLIAHS